MKPSRFLLIGAFAVVAACQSSGGSSQGGTVSHNSGNHAASNDVVISACGPNTALEGWKATVTVTNHTSKASDYLVTVTFNSADGSKQYDSTIAAANAVQPGQTATADAIALQTIPEGAVCKIANVTRVAS